MHKRYSHIFNIFLAVFLVFTACAPPNQPVKVNTPTPKSLVKAPVQKPVLLDKAYEVKPPKPYKGTGYEKASGFKTQDYIDPSDPLFVTPTEYQFDATYNYATFEMPSSGSITGTSSRMVRPFVSVTELATHPVTKDTFAKKIQVEMKATLYTYSSYSNNLYFENEIDGIFYLVSEDGKTYIYDDERPYRLSVNTRYHNNYPIKTDPASNPCIEKINASFSLNPTEPDLDPPFLLDASVDTETHEFGYSFSINHAITGDYVSSTCSYGNIDSTIELSFSGKGPIPMVASTPDSLTLEIPDTELELGQTANLQVSSNVSDRQWTMVVSPSSLDSDSCSASNKTYTGFGGTSSFPNERTWPSGGISSYFTPNGTYKVDLTFTDVLDLEYPPLQSTTLTVNNAFQLSKNRAQIRQGQDEVALGIQGSSCPGWSLEVNGCVIASGAAQNRVDWDGVCGDLEPGTHTVELKADGEVVGSVSIDILDSGTIPPSPTPTPEPSPSSTPTPEPTLEPTPTPFPSPSSSSDPGGGGDTCTPTTCPAICIHKSDEQTILDNLESTNRELNIIINQLESYNFSDFRINAQFSCPIADEIPGIAACYSPQLEQAIKDAQRISEVEYNSFLANIEERKAHMRKYTEIISSIGPTIVFFSVPLGPAIGLTQELKLLMDGFRLSHPTVKAYFLANPAARELFINTLKAAAATTSKMVDDFGRALAGDCIEMTPHGALIMKDLGKNKNYSGVAFSKGNKKTNGSLPSDTNPHLNWSKIANNKPTWGHTFDTSLGHSQHSTFKQIQRRLNQKSDRTGDYRPIGQWVDNNETAKYLEELRPNLTPYPKGELIPPTPLPSHVKGKVYHPGAKSAKDFEEATHFIAIPSDKGGYVTAYPCVLPCNK